MEKSGAPVQLKLNASSPLETKDGEAGRRAPGRFNLMLLLGLTTARYVTLGCC